MHAQVFPLQPRLIESVIAFANSRPGTAEEIAQLFDEGWRPPEMPSVSQCLRIRAEVREWLSDLPVALTSVAAMLGYDGTNKVERGIRIVGALGFRGVSEGKDMKYEVLVSYWAQSTLRTVCGLGIATIFQAGLQDLVSLCARNGCHNYFVDRESRGTVRKYCKTVECDRALNRAYVARSRGAK